MTDPMVPPTIEPNRLTNPLSFEMGHLALVAHVASQSQIKNPHQRERLPGQMLLIPNGIYMIFRPIRTVKIV